MMAPLLAVQTLVPMLPRPGPEDPGPFAFGEPTRVTRILTAAGFATPSFTRFDMAMQLGTTLDDAVEQAATVGAASRALAGQPDDVMQAARAAIRAALAPHAGPNAVELPGAVWLVSAYCTSRSA
jgi:hypothetical protein